MRKSKLLIDYFFIFVLIATSGSAAFFASKVWLLLPVLLILFFKRNLKIRVYEIVFFAFATFLVFSQNLYFANSLQITQSIIIIFTLLSIYLISRITQNNFLTVFRKIVILLCVSSLFFWSLSLLFAPFKDVLLNFAQSLPQMSNNEAFLNDRDYFSYHFYIYNVYIGDNIRNAGMFYEPGRFAIFIVLSFVISIFRNDKRVLSKENILYLLTLITTFSTAGYVAIMIAIVVKLLISKSNPFLKFSTILIFVFTFIIVGNMDFMLSKITHDMGNTETYSRFGAILYHWALILKSPFIGWGDHLKDLEMSPNGLTFMIVKWGVLFSIFYYYFLYVGVKAFYKNKKNIKVFSMTTYLVLLALSFSQTATTESFYFALMFIGLNSYSLNKQKHVRKNYSPV